MPPLCPQAVKASVTHRGLEDLKVTVHHPIGSVIMQFRRGSEFVEKAWHGDLATVLIDQGSIDRHTPGMERAVPFEGIGNIRAVVALLPELYLSGERAVGVPDL